MLVHLYLSTVSPPVEGDPAPARTHQPPRVAAGIEEVHGPQEGMRVCAHGSGGGDLESIDLASHVTGNSSIGPRAVLFVV